MSIYTENPEIFNGPLRLTVEERANPKKVFIDFFDDYSLCEIRDWLWKIVNTCQTSSDPSFDDPDKRSDLLHFGERLEALLEATSILIRQKKDLPESSLPAKDLNETGTGSNDNIDLNTLQTNVMDIQLKVAELVVMVTKAWCSAMVKSL